MLRKIAHLYAFAGFYAVPILVSAVPDIQMGPVFYLMLIHTHSETLKSVGENLISAAKLISTALPSFETDCLIPVKETLADLSNPQYYPTANTPGTGMDLETYAWDLTATDIYTQINDFITGILSTPVSLPEDVWTVREETVTSTTTFQEALDSFATAMLVGAVDFENPSQLSNWLFTIDINDDRAILSADGFLEVIVALKVLEDMVWDAMERVESGYYAAQWWVKDGGAGYIMLKEPLAWGKGFWGELGNMLMKVRLGLEEVRETVGLGGVEGAPLEDLFDDMELGGGEAGDIQLEGLEDQDD
ncbi:hypothetical protein TWF694_008124 [Orbilia ellipsospora]|uniref:Uncharacterized protein n=1 Tax=Orbilia ellipsospora TaxID=2528407 RepID=A0AAV9XGJ7_9PEZI